MLAWLGEAVLSGLLTFLVLLAVAAVPSWGGPLAVFAPLPLTVVTARNGIGTGSLGLLALTLFLGWWGSILSALPSLLELGILALVLGEGLRRRWRGEKTVVLGVLGAAAGALLAVLPQISWQPGRLMESWDRHLSLRLNQFGGVLGLASLAPESWASIKSFLLETYPSLIFLALLFAATANFYLARRIGQRHLFTAEGPDFPFSSWCISDGWVWGVIISLTLYLLALPSRRLGSNLLLALGGLYLLQGLAILSSFLQHWKLSLPLRVPIYFLSLSHPFLLCGLALVGLADVWLNLRRWSNPSLPPRK